MVAKQYKYCILRENLYIARWKLPNTAQCVLEAARHCIVQTAARHTTRHSTHSTDRQLYESEQVSLKNRCILVYMGLYKAAWGQVVLRYICVPVCCCKQLDAYTYTACQGVCINIETLLESFLSIYFVIYLSLYFSSHSPGRIQKDNLSTPHQCYHRCVTASHNSFHDPNKDQHAMIFPS